MGLTHITDTVRGPLGEWANIPLRVDIGAPHTLSPQEVSTALGLSPTRRLAFTLADGIRVERGGWECGTWMAEGSGRTPVTPGESGDEALLGVVMPEILSLGLKPFRRTLQPMRRRLA